MENKNIMDYETVELDDQENALVIIDQTKLPGKTEIIRLKTAQEMWDAIYLLQVRGPQPSAWRRLLEFIFWQSRFRLPIMKPFTVNSKSRKSIWIHPALRQ